MAAELTHPVLAPTGPTPRMTDHARERCAEMEISTKVAKHIARHGDVTYPGTPSEEGPTLVVLWSGDSRFAVVTNDTRTAVLTVLFNTPVVYERAGATFIPRGFSRLIPHA